MHACRHVCIFILCMNVYFEAYIQHVLEPSRALIMSLLTVADADGGNSLFVSAAIIATMKQTKMKLLTSAMLEVALTLLMMIQVTSLLFRLQYSSTLMTEASIGGGGGVAPPQILGRGGRGGSQRG